MEMYDSLPNSLIVNSRLGEMELQVSHLVHFANVFASLAMACQSGYWQKTHSSKANIQTAVSINHTGRKQKYGIRQFGGNVVAGTDATWQWQYTQWMHEQTA